MTKPLITTEQSPFALAQHGVQTLNAQAADQIPGGRKRVALLMFLWLKSKPLPCLGGGVEPVLRLPANLATNGKQSA
jgi:hypothetical protein